MGRAAAALPLPRAHAHGAPAWMCRRHGNDIVIQRREYPSSRTEEERRLFRLVGSGLLAFGTEFLALLAMKSLGVGFLRAFEGGGGLRLRSLLFRRRLGLGLGRFGLGGRRGLRGRGTHQEQRSNGGRGSKGRNLHHGAPRIESEGATVAL